MPSPYFQKLILSSTIRAEELRIPENFANKFRGELSTVATITVLDGRIWRVGLKKIGNSVWFHNGWQEFVEHYYIRVGYFLIFRYEGNSGFFVHIFNLTTSEINYQSNVFGSIQGLNYRNQYNVFEEMEDDDSAEIMGSALPCLAGGHLKNKLLDECGEQMEPSYTPPSLQNLFNGSQLKNCLNQAGDRNLHVSKGVKKSPAEIQATREMRIHFNTSELKKSLDEVKLRSLDQVTLRTKKAMRKKKKPDPDEQVSSTQHEDAGMQFRFYESSSARKRTVIAEERERAINAAKVFKPTANRNVASKIYNLQLQRIKLQGNRSFIGQIEYSRINHHIGQYNVQDRFNYIFTSNIQISCSYPRLRDFLLDLNTCWYATITRRFKKP